MRIQYALGVGVHEESIDTRALGLPQEFSHSYWAHFVFLTFHPQYANPCIFVHGWYMGDGRQKTMIPWDPHFELGGISDLPRFEALAHEATKC